MKRRDDRAQAPSELGMVRLVKINGEIVPQMQSYNTELAWPYVAAVDFESRTWTARGWHRGSDPPRPGQVQFEFGRPIGEPLAWPAEEGAVLMVFDPHSTEQVNAAFKISDPRYRRKPTDVGQPVTG